MAIMADRREADRTVWSIVLAGGEGERVQPFVQRWLGLPRPKQYCAFVGTRSMFQHTVDRARRLVPGERAVVVAARHHRVDVESQLRGRSANCCGNPPTATRPRACSCRSPTYGVAIHRRRSSCIRRITLFSRNRDFSTRCGARSRPSRPCRTGCSCWASRLDCAWPGVGRIAGASGPRGVRVCGKALGGDRRRSVPARGLMEHARPCGQSGNVMAGRVRLCSGHDASL